MCQNPAHEQLANTVEKRAKKEKCDYCCNLRKKSRNRLEISGFGLRITIVTEKKLSNE